MQNEKSSRFEWWWRRQFWSRCWRQILCARQYTRQRAHRQGVWQPAWQPVWQHAQRWRTGFTLVEALVLTILAGYCMVPILGVMSHSVASVQRFDHTETLRTLARSRLNESISIISHERGQVDLNPSFHYVYTDTSGARQSCDSPLPPHKFVGSTPSCKTLDYSYKIDVSYTEQVPLRDAAEGTPVPSDYLKGPTALRALVTRATWLSVDNPATEIIEGRDNGDPNEDESVSLMALVTMPVSHYRNRIFVSDSQTLSIYALDSRFFSLAKTYYPFDSFDQLPKKGTLSHKDNDPFRPTHLAVHPSGNWLAVKMQQKIRLININEDSKDNGKGYDAFTLPSSDNFLENPGNIAAIATNAGLVFRPDGRNLYVTSRRKTGSGKTETKAVILWCLAIPEHLFDSSCSVPGSSFTSLESVQLGNNFTVSAMHAGDDGQLYVANDKTLFWFSMYAPLSGTNQVCIRTFNKQGEKFEQQISAVRTDRLGKKVFLGFNIDNNKNRLLWFPGQAYVANADNFQNYDLLDRPNDLPCQNIGISPDNRYVAVTGLCKAFNQCSLFTNPPIATFTKSATPAFGSNYHHLIYDPGMGSFVIGQKNLGAVHFLNIDDFAAGQLGPAPMAAAATTMKFDEQAKNVVDMVSRAPEYLLVGCSDGTRHSISYLDIQARSLAEQLIILPAAPVSLALHPTGSRVKVLLPANKKTFDVFSGRETPASVLAADQGPGSAVKSVYAIDPDKDAALGKDDFFACISADANAGFFAPQAPPASIADSETGWQGLDLIALNEGGFLALFSHVTEPGVRKLNWYGKYTWDEEHPAGDYGLFATWNSRTHNFPPAFASRMAISADDRLIAFVAAVPSKENRVSLYDFRAQNFDQQTQFQGLISTFQADSADPQGTPAIVFDNGLAKDPFAHWKLDETSGNKAVDSAGSCDGTLSKNMGSSNWVPGYSNNCLNFKGSNEYVDVGKKVDLTDALSIAAWINIPDNIKIRTIVAKESSYILFIRAAEGTLTLGLMPSSSSEWVYCPSPEAVPLGQWLHVAATWDGTTMRVYLNGSEVRHAPFSGSVKQQPSKITTLGTYGSSADHYFKGKLDDVRIWKRALSPAEIVALAGAGKLLNAFSGNETWELAKTSPGNMFHYTAWPDLVGIDKVKAASSKRFFGYYHPGNPMATWLGLAINSRGKLFLDHNCVLSQDFGGFSGDIGLSTPITLTPAKGLPFQLEHTDANPGDMGIAAVTSNKDSPSGPEPGSNLCEHIAGRGSYKGSLGWDRIPAASFTPFLFAPRLLSSFELTNSTGSNAALVFSRDATDPTLYVLDPDGNKIWMQQIGRTRRCILLPPGEQLPGQLVISPDGQKLFYAVKGATDTINIINIATPTTYAFAADIDVSTAPFQAPGDGFGSILASIDMPGPVTCLAARQYIRYGSGDCYETLATSLPNKYANCNIAALNNGGIAIMGGADKNAGTDIVFFDPTTNSVTTSVTKLGKALYNHVVVPFQDQLIAFNGRDNKGLTDWVQAFNTTTEELIHSPEEIKATGEVALSQNMSAAGQCLGQNTSTKISQSGCSIKVGAYWKIFEYSDDACIFTAKTSDYVLCDTGSDQPKMLADRVKIWVDATIYALREFNIMAGDTNKTESFTWKGTTKMSTSAQPFDLENQTAYRYWRFEPVDNHDTSQKPTTDQRVAELRFYKKNVRPLIPVMQGPSTPSRIPGSGKNVTISASSVYNSTVTQAWKVCDADDGDDAYTSDEFIKTGWRSGGAQFPHHLDIDLGMKDTVHMITLHRGGNMATEFSINPDYAIKEFQLLGCNNSSFSNPTVLINCTGAASCPKTSGQLPFYVDSPRKFRYYRLLIKSSYGANVAISNLQMYSFGKFELKPENGFMQKTAGDDKSTRRFERHAACLTPFGIIFSGGLINANTPSDLVSVYWPHAIDQYLDEDEPLGFGSCRNLPPMPGTRVDHNLVWHKGFLYRIGGAIDVKANTIPLNSFDRFDVSNNSWTETTVSGELATALQRRKAAACSFGDEIFIFGGISIDTSKKSTPTTSAFAWNPTTGDVRTLADINPAATSRQSVSSTGTGGHTNTVAMSAVAYGPHIYLLGGTSTDTGAGTNSIVRYTP